MFNAKTTTPQRGELRMFAPFGAAFGGISPDMVQQALDQFGAVKEIDLYLDSDGGIVHDGVAIHNLLKRHPAKVNVKVIGLAASIATYVAMAGDTISMTPDSQFMIHKAWGFKAGDDDDFFAMATGLRNATEIIRDAYAAKTGMPADKVYDLMKAETWMKADKALALGFVDSIEGARAEPHAHAAYAVVDRFKNTPEEIKNRPGKVQSMVASMAMRLQQRNRGASPTNA